MRSPLLLAAFALGLAGAPAVAQTASLPLQPGDRIRIDGPALGADKVVGSVVEIRPSWIGFRVEESGPVYTRKLEFVDEVELATRKGAWDKARVGLAWGAFLGGSIGGISAPLAAFSLGMKVEETIAYGISGGALAGGLVGSGLGVLLASDRWRTFRFVRE